MAERRMMSKKIIHSDAFLDLPTSTQNLYFHLLLEADDEGFVNSPKKIQRFIGASDIDSQLLIDKKFIILFESGVVVIKHWRIHNYIQNDRFKPTSYTEERAKLCVEKNNGYKMYPNCTPSIGEVRLGEDSIEDNTCASEDEFPSWLNREAWDEWVKYRKQKKNPLTELSIKKQLKLLEENKYDHIEIINQSIQNGWTGLFEIKKQTAKKSLAERNREALDAYEQRYSEDVIEGVIE